MSLSRNQSGLDVADWKDVVHAEQDFHAAVGLTKQGKVLISGTIICVVKEDGSLLIKRVN